jgi:thiol:disulfide interchange protein
MVNKSQPKNSLRRVMTCLVIACFALFGEVRVMAQNKAAGKNEIHFADRQWQQTLQLAKKNRQLIFVDAYATWCGPCKDLKIQTFANAEVAAYFNAHFVNVSLDMEKGEGLKFADQYEVQSYPTLLFIDGNGRIVKRSEGFLDAGELLSLAKMTGIKE